MKRIAIFCVLLALALTAVGLLGARYYQGGQSKLVTTEAVQTDQFQVQAFAGGVRVAPVVRDTANNPVLDWGAGAEWDDQGVRDPRLMIDTSGDPVTESDKYILYYTGYADSSTRAIGRATSSDRVTWAKDAGNPILEGAGGEWDANGTLGCCVIKLGAKSYVMFYCSHTGTTYGVGRATSTDGISWTKYDTDGGPILTAADFAGIGATNSMGIPYCIINNAGNYILLFESLVGTHYRIFGATSADGITFTALNSGAALLSEVTSTWEGYGVANPYLYQFASGEYLLGYNGSATDGSEFSIGFAKSSNLTSWTRYPGNPVLVPRVSQANHWEKCRIEGPCLFGDDFGTSSVGMLYFGVRNTSSYLARIGYATIDQTAIVGRVGSGLGVRHELILGPNANQAIYSDGTNLILQSTTGEVVHAEHIFTHTVADNGNGGPATYTLTPTVKYNRIGTYDSDGLTLTLGETGIRDGMTIVIRNGIANNVTIADAADVQTVVGESITLAQYASVRFRYYNAPGTSDPKWFQETAVCTPD